MNPALPNWLVSLSEDHGLDRVGTKAFNLRLLVRLGFTVPPALVISTSARGSDENRDRAERRHRVDSFAARLPGFLPSSAGWAVRSSATVEDREDTSAAGRFDTRFITRPCELGEAVSAVWDSGASGGAGPDSMAVIVQELIAADFSGVAFSRDPTRDQDTVVVEIVEGRAAGLVGGEQTPWRVRCADRNSELPGGFPPALLEEIIAGVGRLARECGHEVDVEWAARGDALFWLQVRPLTGARARRFEIAPELIPRLRGLWVRIQHCFSPQVPLVVSTNPGGYFDHPHWHSRLINGFHYVQMKPAPAVRLPESDFDQVLDRWDQLERRYTELFAVREAVDLSLLRGGDLWLEFQTRAELNRAFFRAYYDPDFYHVRKAAQDSVTAWIREAVGLDAGYQPLLSALVAHLGTHTERKQRDLAGLAQRHAAAADADLRDSPQWREFICSFGFESASTQLFYLPTLAETPELVMSMVAQLAQRPPRPVALEDWRAAASTVADRLEPARRERFREDLNRLRRCLKRTEDDDYLLQRGTACVRSICLCIGRHLRDAGVLSAPDEVFFLEGEELQQLLGTGLDLAEELAIAVGQRRAAFADSQGLSPPPMIVNGRVMNPRRGASAGVMTGTPASPGVASGPAVVLRDPFACTAGMLPPGAVVVTPIITPAMAYMLMGCAAVVTEAGGMASHGAIVAREMGIPAVVGVKGVVASLTSGVVVSVDGTRGELIMPSGVDTPAQSPDPAA